MGSQQKAYELMLQKKIDKFRAPDKPACFVWDDAAKQFCRRVSVKTGKAVRLPTEAEWEHAARAGSRTKYSFGDDEKALEEHAWYWANSKSVQPVGQKKPNAWGLYDMHGNVWEWTSDWYADSFVGAGATDPQGAESGDCRVMRGGAWPYLADGCRSAVRFKAANTFSEAPYLGFRVVVEE
jgi:formylglycine-generating enzyme required for sulfatase activity